MALLKFKQTMPPGGWFYIQPETRCRIESDNLAGLVKRVLEHRTYKDLPQRDTVEIRKEIERQICSRLSDAECKAEGDSDEWRPVKIHEAILRPKTVLNASRAALQWLAGGGEHVPRETALKRKETCAACPLNTPLTGCKCGTVYKALNAALPKEKKFSELGVCAVCACSLQLKVWLPRQVIEASNKDSGFAYPAHCWQPKE